MRSWNLGHLLNLRPVGSGSDRRRLWPSTGGTGCTQRQLEKVRLGSKLHKNEDYRRGRGKTVRWPWVKRGWVRLRLTYVGRGVGVGTVEHRKLWSYWRHHPILRVERVEPHPVKTYRWGGRVTSWFYFRNDPGRTLEGAYTKVKQETGRKGPGYPYGGVSRRKSWWRYTWE